MILHPTPQVARIIDRVQESPTIFTWTLEFTDPEVQAGYAFKPGQFNMLYLMGAGEVPISIVSDPRDPHLRHTIRAVGRVTRAMAQRKVGDTLGVRGPFGRGWPLEQAEGRDLLLITGGLGCAPLVSVIHYAMKRREAFGRIAIIQGVKHSDDLIWREHYDQWAKMPDVQVLLAADVAGGKWRWHVGLVTDLLGQLEMKLDNALVMMCGPEPMMRASASHLQQLGCPMDSIWLSMERNMQCATGLCGHCQYGADFICRDGPVFPLPHIHDRLGVKGF